MVGEQTNGEAGEPAARRSSSRRRRWLLLVLPALILAALLLYARATLIGRGLCIPFLTAEIRQMRTIRVDVTPLARLDIPDDLQLPEGSRQAVQLRAENMVEPWFLLGETVVHLARDPSLNNLPQELSCNGSLVRQEEAGEVRLYCEIRARQQLNEFNCGMGYDSRLVLTKGSISIAITNLADDTPDGESESQTVRMLARIWEQRILRAEYQSFEPGEYIYAQWCERCHNLAQPSRIAPNLQGVYLSPVTLQGGQILVADESYLLESIRQPDAHTVDGYPAGVMPSVEQMPAGWRLDSSLDELISFLQSWR